jgi:hypothetical protein
MLNDNCGKSMQGPMAEVQAQNTTAVAQIPKPHVLMAMTGGPSAVEAPSHHPTSVVIRVATVGLQASRALRWRARIDDCCADAAGLQRDATDWPWRLLIVSCGS